MFQIKLSRVKEFATLLLTFVRSFDVDTLCMRLSAVMPKHVVPCYRQPIFSMLVQRMFTFVDIWKRNRKNLKTIFATPHNSMCKSGGSYFWFKQTQLVSVKNWGSFSESEQTAPGMETTYLYKSRVKQGKKVCKATAVRCCRCFSWRLLLSKAKRLKRKEATAVAC